MAFIFCLGFSALFGCFFAWTYHYRKLHKEPQGRPQAITGTMTIPIDIAGMNEQDLTAIRRIEQEKTSFEIDSSYKDAFIKKLLSLFHERLEKESRGVLALCYWAFKEEGFTLRLSISPYRINENLFVPKNDRYFSKKEFNWNGIDEAPLDIFQSSEQVSRSIAGSVVSGDGKLRGYITIDSAHENAFDDSMVMELRELANLAEEMFRILDLNLKFDRENNLLNSMLVGISYIFRAVSKGNLIANLSKYLQDNFVFDRLMIITPDTKDKNKWHIAEAVGLQKEGFKGVTFSVHKKCLLYDILSGGSTVVNETKISVDPYQRRLYENEPENLELRSLFAVMPTIHNNSYSITIVLESKRNRAVSRIESQILTCLASCAAVKLSDIQEKEAILQKKEDDLIGIDSNGLGELLSYYEKEIADLRNSNECLGILFLKCKTQSEENKALNFERFSMVLKRIKKAWNGRHLAMLGNGEFVFSIKGNFDENTFKMTARQIIANAENLLAEDNLDVKSYDIWLNREEIPKKEEKMGHDYETLFKLTILRKFMDMAGEV